MKKVLILFLFILTGVVGLSAQTSTEPLQGYNGLLNLRNPHFAIKSNLLYDATTTFNLGVEFAVGKKWTIDVPVNYNPWTFSGDKKIKHVLVQPELRFWTCERFNGHFFGIHGHYGRYNAGGIKLPFDMFESFEISRYDGYLVGGGISYGYQWILGNHWNLEATIGVGYARLNYDKYHFGSCDKFIRKGHDNYFGPTKVGLSIIYIIK